MGCCASRPSSPSNNTASRPYPPVATSDAALTASSPPAATSLASPRGSHASTSVAPNSPLKQIPPNLRSILPNTVSSPTSQRRRILPLTSQSATWTRSRLERERRDWWDTRVNGTQEIWGAVRMVCELIQRGDITAAQAVLDASGCTCPSGEVWRGVFDERGGLYKVEEWVVVEPKGVVGDDEVQDSNSEEEVVPRGGHGDSVREPSGDDKEVQVQDSRRDKEADMRLNVRCRLSNPPKDYVIKINQSDRVALLSVQLRDLPELKNKRFRLFILGQTLDDRLTLCENTSRWNESIIVNVMVFG